MSFTREPIHVALFNKLSTVAAFLTSSRKLQHWSDVPPVMQPAFFLTESIEDVVNKFPGANPVSEIRFDAYIYVNTGTSQDAPNTAPSTLFNPIVDAIFAALLPDNPVTNKCTLGNLVQHVWIEGQIKTDEGNLGDQGVVIIPIVVKAV